MKKSLFLLFLLVAIRAFGEENLYKEIPQEILDSQQEIEDEIASKPSLYDKNRDLTNWTVRDNWRYQQEAFFRGNTKIDLNGPTPYNFRDGQYYYSPD